jgi:hypothetical protein
MGNSMDAEALDSFMKKGNHGEGMEGAVDL